MDIQQKNEKLAMDIADFLSKNSLAQDVRIYYNNMCLSDWKDGEWKVLTDIKSTDYFEYGNNDTVSMSFEGALYHMVNYGERKSLFEKFNEIFNKHKCYYQFGYAWSLSVYYD